MQTILKCKKGIGESFLFHHEFQGIYDSRILDKCLSDSEEIENNLLSLDITEYCKYIFYKIYYWLEIYLNLRLIEMQGEFLIDENLKIWLIHATNIIVKPNDIKINTKIEVNYQEIKKNIINEELITHLANAAKEPKSIKTVPCMRLSPVC